MKLRLQGDAVRLRVSRAEVETLASGGVVTSTTRFMSGGELAVELRQGGAWKVRLEDGGRLAVAAPGLDSWAASNDEGLYHGEVAVEKDFACLHRDEAGNEGTFPNPAASVKQ